MIPAGLEPAVFGSEDQRLIHQATGPISGISGHHHISAARAVAPLRLFQCFLQCVPDTSPKLIQDVSNYFMAARPGLSARVFLTMTAVGFEPTPLRTGARSQRLRPLGQTVYALITCMLMQLRADFYIFLKHYKTESADTPRSWTVFSPGAVLGPAPTTRNFHKHSWRRLKGFLKGCYRLLKSLL